MNKCILLIIICFVSYGYGQTGERFKKWIDAQEEFPIGAWSFAWRTSKTQSWFDTYAEANLNMIQVDTNQLKFTKAAGLNAVLGTWDEYFLPSNRSSLENAIKLANDSANRISIFILKDDAPNFKKHQFHHYYHQYDFINWVVNKEIYPKLPSRVITQINFLPNWAVPESRFKVPYNTLVDQGLERCNPSVVGYSHYPTLKSSDNATSPSYFNNLELFRNRSYDLVGNRGPGIFGFISLVEWTGGGADSQDTRKSSETDCRWQVNMHLAYGAKGLWWYNYQIKEKDKDNFGNGMLEHTTNKKTDLYKIVKDINQTVLNWGDKLMDLESTSVSFMKNKNGGIPRGVREYKLGDVSSDFDVSGDGGICIARFDYPWNSEWYNIMVVNMQHGGNNYDQTIFNQKVICKFSDKLAHRRQINPDNGKDEEIQFDTYRNGWFEKEFELKGGEALFFTVKKTFNIVLEEFQRFDGENGYYNIDKEFSNIKKIETIYPNPVEDLLNVNLSDIYYTNYILYNLEGKVLRNNKIEDGTNKLEVNMSDFSKGIYLLKIEGVETSKIFRILKE
ncbi:T9SS type A sorting domain-containing protein [Aquimarina latercula]|uniref:T9SS type A sorting domain-containing protein n=1 Tax=Aquimarina latercula TaxID=987 RepID=UPI00042634B9|nr:T9SS type A sorting domain-containing protein [Aquimarina latercula]